MEKLNLFFFTVEGNIFFSIGLIIVLVSCVILFIKLVRDMKSHTNQEDDNSLKVNNTDRKTEVENESSSKKHSSSKVRETVVH